MLLALNQRSLKHLIVAQEVLIRGAFLNGILASKCIFA